MYMKAYVSILYNYKKEYYTHLAFKQFSFSLKKDQYLLYSIMMLLDLESR